MSNLEKNCLISPKGKQIYYSGPAATEGIKPAVIYFALSANMSLHVDPFNQPVLEWNKSGIRVFSWDLPFHSKDLDPNRAMHQWAKEFAQNPAFVSDFIEECLDNLLFLHHQHLIDFAKLGLGGLSRGEIMAAHLAAQEPRIPFVLGFAPLTTPKPLEEFIEYPSSHYEEIALAKLADKLIHTHVKFYIGNNDIRVGTEACYSFIKELTKQAISGGVRSPQAELIIYPSIGFRGHGTPPHIFVDGAAWLKDRLITFEK